MTNDPLAIFLEPVQAWFRRALGEPTPVQRQGWPIIAAGQNALLLAPTGSGKTLAAFLACLDRLWRQEPIQPGVQILYVSPLKALNNDIYRNLKLPLAGVAAMAQELGVPLPHIDIAIRTGDTPQSERQRLVRRPPHVLITTPESLHLLLTSKARDTLKNVTHCIVDEIHALCPNKRGVFLALLLERLRACIGHDFARIGLSATQRPLEEVARYLGGFACDADGPWRERPVSIVDAGLRKNLDLEVVSPVDVFGPLPEKSIWPSLCRRLADEISRHRSTIVFANNRRSVERLTAMLNEHLGKPDAPAREPAASLAGASGSNGIAATESAAFLAGASDSDGTAATDAAGSLAGASGSGGLQVRAHHGSVSLEMRQQTEQALKEGRLRAVVATASLELGIDMGAVDLVCQVESPGNVARGLQRVGRAGHLVGQSSKGRLFAKTLPDLVNEAVLAAQMAAGRVEMLRVPMNCLDVLAQQIIAMTAMDDWPIAELYHVVRQAYPYRDLTPAAFDSVLEMISGRYRFTGREGEARAEPSLTPLQQLTALQPRISWDRIHQRLHALPGSQRLALVHGGTIPDTGQYAVYTTRHVRVGEVDEEFVYERRVGDAFLLGTNAWRIDRIDTDRVIVTPAEGAPAMTPFWRGEQTGRTYDLGLAQGRFLRELGERLDRPDCLDWLMRDHFLDAAAARNLRDFVRRQKQRLGHLPTDRTITIEAARDPLGDWQVVLLNPLGRAVNFGLRLAIERALSDRLGYRPQCLHHDDGVLVRLTESDEPVLDLLAGITPDNVRDMILAELGESALFALRFRQNAARALMMPRGAAGKRAPLWLQRLRGRDLLQVARRHADFPIIAETFRECLHDHLDLPRLQELLGAIGAGTIEVRTCRLEAPSPFAANLLFAFTMAYMYQYDDVEPDGERRGGAVDHELLDQLIGHAGPLPLEPRAVRQVDRRLRNVGLPPRSKAETAEWLRHLGDATSNELEGPIEGFLRELERDGIAITIDLRTPTEPKRWILAEEAELYRTAFGLPSPPGRGAGGEGSQHPAVSMDSGSDGRQAAAAAILRRFLQTHALVGLDDILERYPLERSWAILQLEEWTKSGALVRIAARETEPLQWSAPDNYAQMQRGSLSLLRREVMTCPADQFVDFLLRWQYVHPAARLVGPDGVGTALMRLQGMLAPADLWERTILPSRCRDFGPRLLDEAIASGRWAWYCGEYGESEGAAFIERGLLSSLPPPIPAGAQLDRTAAALVEQLRGRGALFSEELATATGLPLPSVRKTLWALVRAGAVSNDRFDVLRRGEPPASDEPPDIRSRGQLRAFLRDSRRRRERHWPEGRWALLGWGQPDPESAALFEAKLLLDRYGIVARELAILSGTVTPWRVLYEVYSRLELAGDVRRGYFVEGLSGAQFAWPDAARSLSESAQPSHADAPAILLHSLDPANLFGSGAPLELLTPGPEPRSFQRRAGNWLIVKAGRPILLVELNGKRLTAAPAAADADLADAVTRLPDLLHRTGENMLRVETWNDGPITSTVGKNLLEQAGFVRDYQAMTLWPARR